MQFVICDVDDVLLEMEPISRLAEEAIIDPLTRRIGPSYAEAVQAEFARAIRILRRYHQNPAIAADDAYQEIMTRMTQWQRGVTAAGYEVKSWSRHALVACALEACELPVTATVVQEAADHYWSFLAQRAAVYPDAVALIEQLSRADIPIQLATGSDGFLTFDDARQTFIYDPEEAQRHKRDRLHHLYRLGFQPSHISIGDPVGKPSLDFFRQALYDFSHRIGREIELAQTVAIGDSLSQDILPLLELGAARGVWVWRNTASLANPPSNPPAHVDVVTQLDTPALQALLNLG